jgi:aspartate/tyrosine/aromatic aminotransferase
VGRAGRGPRPARRDAFIDQAYFGLGDGLDEDLAGMRRLLRVVPEAFVAVSASKAWGLELEAMRRRLGRLRDGLAAGTGFAGLGRQRGMFLTLPLDAAAMLRLRQTHGVYGLPSGRINLAGIPYPRIEAVSSAIRSVGGRNHEISV